MAKAAREKAKSRLLTKAVILALLAAMGWQLYSLRDQLESAQAARDRLASQVASQQQENDALAADIAAGGTQEKMEEIARGELGMVSPNERVFYPNS